MNEYADAAKKGGGRMTVLGIIMMLLGLMSMFSPLVTYAGDATVGNGNRLPTLVTAFAFNGANAWGNGSATPSATTSRRRKGALVDSYTSCCAAQLYCGGVLA